MMLFGAVYLIEQDYTDEEMRRDLQNMKACGYNLITLWPVGNPWLARSSTEWVFDKTRYVLDLCEELGMKAILQLFGQNQAQEFMPDSVVTEEMLVHDERGECVNANCYWANLNHPVVREWIGKFFAAAITALRGHPALYGWDVFNEAHFRSDDPWTTAEYQKWLQARYGTIEALNRAWYRRYETFSQITPHLRKSAYSIWSSLLPDVEYERFRSENLTDLCRFLYDTAKKYDGEHPILIDGTSSQILASSVIERNNNEFDTAKIPDIYGATFYPKSWGRNYRQTPWTLSMYLSIPAAAAQKAGKPYFVNELQTHTQSVLTPGSEVTPRELYDWTMMCVFTGIQGFQYWRWRPFLHGYQATGRGLTRMDGTPNERSEATRRAAAFLAENDALLGAARPAAPDVRLGLSYSSRLYFDSLLKWQPSDWDQEVEGWYKLFWEQGLRVGFADLDELDERELSAPVLVLPGIVSLSDAAARRLADYVERGGILIADARLRALDEAGVVPSEGIPGRTLWELFGARELDVGSGDEICLGESRCPTGLMTQELELSPQTRVLARFGGGAPAVTLREHGKGCAIYAAYFAGMGMLQGGTELLSGLLMPELRHRVPGLITAQKGERVHLAALQSGGKRLTLAINFSDEPQQVRLQGLPEGGAVHRCGSEEAVTDGLLTLQPGTCEVFWWEEAQ